MSSEQERAARRIMDQFGEESRIPILNIDEGDVGVLLAFPIAALFIVGLLELESLAFPLVMAGLGLGVAIIYVTPDHLNAWQWATSVSRFIVRPRTTYNAPASDEGEDTEITRNEGGLANRTPFKPDERTQDLTNVRRAWAGTGAIQRTDGTMEAFLELSPGNMDFAMSGDWAHLQQVGEEFANKELDWPLTFHATTRAFPVEGLIERVEDRLEDDDVAANPVFRDLLGEYRSQRPKEMRQRGIQEIRYFIGVQVDEWEVYDRYRDERTPAEKLTEFPVIGVLFTPFVTRRESFSNGERHDQMVEKLDERLDSVRSGLIQNASGWSGRRLSTLELFALNMAFWNGHERVDEPTLEAMLGAESDSGSSPVGGESDA